MNPLPSKQAADALNAQNAAVVFMMVDGEVHEKKYGIINVTGAQKVFAEQLVKFLNIEVAHGGEWRVVWEKPVRWSEHRGIVKAWIPSMMTYQWRDADGDIKTVLESGDTVYEMLEIGMTHYATMAEEAWQKTKEFYGLVDVKPSQTFKKAKGQAPITQHPEAPASEVSIW